MREIKDEQTTEYIDMQLDIVNFMNNDDILSKEYRHQGAANKETKISLTKEKTKMKKQIRNRIKKLELAMLTLLMAMPFQLLISWLIEGYGHYTYTLIITLINVVIELLLYIRVESNKNKLKSLLNH